MVRAGVVTHPSEWAFSGYNEIQAPHERYALITCEGLRELLNFRLTGDLAEAYRGWIEEGIGAEGQLRNGKWSESIAVGSESFVMMTKEKLGIKAKGREVVGGDGSYELREAPAAYNGILGHENDVLRSENTYFWEDSL